MPFIMGRGARLHTMPIFLPIRSSGLNHFAMPERMQLSLIHILSLLLYRYLCQKWRGDSRFAQRMTAAVLAFAFLFSVVHIGIGKFGQWYTDSDLVKQDTNACLLYTSADLFLGEYKGGPVDQIAIDKY